jgi:hypothetical protein
MKTIVFFDQDFPCQGFRPEDISRFYIDQADTVIVRADELSEALLQEDACCYIHLHGPYFPRVAWSSILEFLRKGKGLVYAGGAPFRIPVINNGQGKWLAEKEVTAYHQSIHIHEALKVDALPIHRLEAHSEIPLLSGKEELFTVEPTFNIIMHPTKHKDILHENGACGPMDARIYPLLKGISAGGREVAAPVVLIENTMGEFAGGRWIFINQQLTAAFWNGKGVKTLSELAAFCSRGVTEIWLKANYAVYYEQESPRLTLHYQKICNPLIRSDQQEEKWSFDLTVRWDETQEKVWSTCFEAAIDANLQMTSISVPVEIKEGSYHIDCRAVGEKGDVRYYRQGFWGFDAELLREGAPLSCDRDYFRKNDKPFPVVGMTYMTSDVARKYLFLPNVYRWDQDMQTMKEAGINWIRTGLWTGWRQIMFADGHVSEEILRAIDAFILTAKKYELEVTFTFFSFTPEAWEGANPYLDPRSIEAQKRFILSIVNRHRNTTNVQWDLINEPSLFDPQRIFTGPRPVHDSYEKRAFAKWLQGRHGTIEKLQSHWNMTPGELPDFPSADLPEQTEIAFHVEDMRRLKKNNRWLDYTLFTMEMHNRWANELRAAIQSVAPKQFVTVGQDEALGRGPRPSPFFYAEAVDYTTVHTWWLNDQLVWDGVFAKTPDKPSLIQETGVMYLEHPNNAAKRSEEEIRDLLERKYAYAFATGGAGAIHWLWNTNYFMDNINESNIGALRADGTQKPEAEVSYQFGSLMRHIGGLFENRKREDVAVIFPYSNDFSSRRLAFEATTKTARVLAYNLRIPFHGLSEYHLASLDQEPPKLILVPSPHNFNDEAMAKLISTVKKHGSTLLFTGPIALDEYWYPSQRLQSVLGETCLTNVVREEILEFGGKSYPVSFSERKIAEVNKEVLSDDAVQHYRQGITRLQAVKIGKGELVWCPLPVELNVRKEVLEKLYAFAMEKAGLTRDLEWIEGGENRGVYGRKLSFDKGDLFVFVSEFAADTPIAVKDRKTKNTYRFILERGRVVVFATNSEGQFIASLRDISIKIEEPVNRV